MNRTENFGISLVKLLQIIIISDYKFDMFFHFKLYTTFTFSILLYFRMIPFRSEGSGLILIY